VGARAIAWTQPKADHELGFFENRQQRMQARLVAQARVTGEHALLMAVLMKQTGAVEVQRVAAAQARQPPHGPIPERGEGALIDPRMPEKREKTGERRLTGDLLDPRSRRNIGSARNQPT